MGLSTVQKFPFTMVLCCPKNQGGKNVFISFSPTSFFAESVTNKTKFIRKLLPIRSLSRAKKNAKPSILNVGVRTSK